MNPNYLAWKLRAPLREQGATAVAALDAANTAQSTANTAQSTANTGVTNAGTAQDTADDALEVAEGAVATAGQAQAAAGKSPTPYILPISGGTQAEVRLGPGLTADSFQYQINGGGYGGYSGAFSISPGDTVMAYSVTSGLTDSDVVTYEN